MTACDEFISMIERMLPEHCSVKDLVKEGIFLSPQCEFHARKVGHTPSYFKLGRRIMYPRNAVIEWLKEQKYENNKPDTYQAPSYSPPKHARLSSCG